MYCTTDKKSKSRSIVNTILLVVLTGIGIGVFVSAQDTAQKALGGMMCFFSASPLVRSLMNYFKMKNSKSIS